MTDKKEIEIPPSLYQQKGLWDTIETSEAKPEKPKKKKKLEWVQECLALCGTDFTEKQLKRKTIEELKLLIQEYEGPEKVLATDPNAMEKLKVNIELAKQEDTPVKIEPFNDVHEKKEEESIPELEEEAFEYVGDDDDMDSIKHEEAYTSSTPVNDETVALVLAHMNVMFIDGAGSILKLFKTPFRISSVEDYLENNKKQKDLMVLLYRDWYRENRKVVDKYLNSFQRLIFFNLMLVSKCITK